MGVSLAHHLSFDSLPRQQGRLPRQQGWGSEEEVLGSPGMPFYLPFNFNDSSSFPASFSKCHLRTEMRRALPCPAVPYV